MVPDMRDPADIISAAAEMVERTKRLLEITDDRLRLSRLQLEQSRKLMQRFTDFETSIKRRRSRG